jgi:hypothetical protein
MRKHQSGSFKSKRQNAERQNADGLHAAIFVTLTYPIFPPMTLFTVVEEHEPGWLFDGTAALLEKCRMLSPAFRLPPHQ